MYTERPLPQKHERDPVACDFPQGWREIFGDYFSTLKVGSLLNKSSILEVDIELH